ncbi:MAG: methionyl-tRNA formyltransferase [Candidatus Roizmanbacteria bacterium]|nr:MAG: methionyl-tRNA formyltransferase [Candidatus Roizmanbacteria bacterium]
MKKLKIAYFGTPYFSADFLEKILTDNELPVEVKFIITQPDQPAGRKQTLTPTPVKEMAKKYGIDVYGHLAGGANLGIPSARRFKRALMGKNERQNLPNALKNIDIALLYAYGKIIPSNLLTIPKLGFWNIHPSLLPKYRGPSPMATPLILGDKETGVTLIKMDEQMDHGPIIAQEKYEIKPDDRRPDLEKKLTDLGYEIFKKTIINCRHRSRPVPTREQDHIHATYTHLLNKNDGFIPFEILNSIINNRSSKVESRISKIKDQRSKIYNLFRGLYPWPGIWTKVNINGQEKRLKITDMECRDNPRVVPSCELIIKKVQLEDKKEVDFKIFQKAYLLF